MNHLTTHKHRESSYLRAYYLRAYKALHLSRVLYKSTLFMQNKPNLLNAQMNVTSFITKDYENKRLADAAKTNPIQSQSKPISTPKASFRPQNKPNSNPIKPKNERKRFFTKGL